MDDTIEIVSSFPHPPRQFYEHLSIDEIKSQAAPELKSELTLFGTTTSLVIDNASEIMLTEQTISELKRLKAELMSNYQDIIANIEQIQGDNAASEISQRITKPAEEIFSILKRLRTLESACNLIATLKDDFAAIEAFLQYRSALGLRYLWQVSQIADECNTLRTHFLQYLNSGQNECPLCKVQITMTSLTRHMSSTTMVECILRIKAKVTGNEAQDLKIQQEEALLCALDGFADADEQQQHKEPDLQAPEGEAQTADQELTQITETCGQSTQLNTQITLPETITPLKLKPETLCKGPTSKKAKFSKIGFLLTGLSEDQRYIVNKSMSAIKDLFHGIDVTIERDYSPQKVTHILCACAPLGRCPRTLKYLMGIAGKSWIVSLNWVLDSLSLGTILDEHGYMVIGDEVVKEDTFACQVSRSDPDGLFAGLDFVLLGNFKGPGPSKSELASLIQLAGGRIVQTASAGVIAISNNTNGPRPGERSFTWLFDCLSRYQLDK